MNEPSVNTTTTCTLQDVIEFLRVNMQVEVRVEQVPYERSGLTKVEVRVKLGDEVITQGSDTFYNR